MIASGAKARSSDSTAFISLALRSSHEVGSSQRVHVEVSGTGRLAGLRASARPGDPERSSSCELAEVCLGSGYALRRAGRDHDGGRLERARGLVQRVEWGIGPEEGDPPAALAQGEAEDDERQIVLFPRRARQESAGAGTRSQPRARPRSRPRRRLLA